MTAAEALAFVEREGLTEACRAAVKTAPPLPADAVDLLRETGLPVRFEQREAS